MIEAWEELVDYVPNEEQWTALESKALEKEKALAAVRINAYFDSAEVKSFVVDGKEAWWDDAKRSTLRNMIESRKENGDENIELWFNDTAITVTYTRAIEILNSIEIYASEIFNQRQTKLNEITGNNDIWAIREYNEKSGYPEKPVIEL